MALKRKWIASPCYHGRNVGGTRLIVMHTAEGATTIESLGNFFSNYNNQVSSHVGADDKLGTIGEYVTRGNAAWTQADYNNVAVAMELCGFASWSSNDWKNKHHNMLRNAADWIAEESKKLGIPITKLSASQAKGGARGVCQHRDLAPGGGNHSDCGNGFPMDYVISLARGGSPDSNAPSRKEERVMQLVFDAGSEGHAPGCSIAIPNEYNGGNHKLRFSCKDATKLRVDVGSGGIEIDLGYLAPMSVKIPKGQDDAVVKRDTGTAPVSVAFSEQ